MALGYDRDKGFSASWLCGRGLHDHAFAGRGEDQIALDARELDQRGIVCQVGGSVEI
jgi:hypothetical protein